MRSDRFVVNVPLLDQDLGLPQGTEDFAVKQLALKPSIETFAVAVFRGKRGWT